MAQHFLLSTQARTLSLAKVLRLSDAEAYDAFKAIRFADNGGEAFCPKCQSQDLYDLPRRKMWRCKKCPCQFSVTSGTIFASRKLSIRDILAAIAIFANGAKGKALNKGQWRTVHQWKRVYIAVLYLQRKLAR